MTVGPESTYVKLTPTYETCHTIIPFIGTRTAAVTANGCSYTFNATTNTNSPGGTPTPFSADLTIECPTKPMEFHIYNTANHNPTGASTLCTYDIGNQTINNQIQLTNTAGIDILAHINASISVTNTILGGVCGGSANPASTYKGVDTLTAFTYGAPVGTTVS